jgi:hypothetical protein
VLLVLLNLPSLKVLRFHVHRSGLQYSLDQHVGLEEGGAEYVRHDDE